MTENNTAHHNMTTNDLPSNPYDLFKKWFQLAVEKEPNDPNALCLATVDQSGAPSVRMVLLKAVDYDKGFGFYTNAQSRKGQEMVGNANVAACFHWKSLRKQIRIEGTVEEVDQITADAYFASRDRASRVGAWASRQSAPLENFETLKNHVEDKEREFEGREDIPRPPHWKGYRIVPRRIEFWIDGQYRLHQRYVYDRQADGSWAIGMLYP